ncbi:MAG: hypothetical protein KY476_26200, partial [Planctomycetes bacterium]|nr:hypothetical protein [Planctomycetota bacterium]
VLFAILALLLFDPLWSGVRARPRANLFVILADNSRSLSIADGDANEPRSSAVRTLLARRPHDWQTRLEQDFDVRRYTFDRQLAPTDDFAALDFTGKATHLAHALETIRERYRGRPLAGVLLVSDGNATDWDPTLLERSGLPPVYPVVAGSEEPLPDLAIERVDVSQSAFEDAPVTIQSRVRTAGFKDVPLKIVLLDEDGEVAAEETRAVSDDEEILSFRFQVRPVKPGTSFLRLEVSAADRREATLENNARFVTVPRPTGPHRVLYVSGRPNWEFKFLNRAVADDSEVELAALIRIAKREAKFDFRGRAGESSNPLFRGFKQNADAETERYDEPVLVRLNMKDAAELQGGFPRTAEDLFAFKAVVLDDLEAAFFTHEQLELLERFVAHRGGALLMLGGQESFHNGGYEHTPVGRMLPVYLDNPAGDSTFRRDTFSRDSKRSALPPMSGLRLELSREGWLEPWMRLRTTEDAERDRLAAMPSFRTLNRTSGIKAGAQTMAWAVDSGGARQPALVVQRYGRGRTAALPAGDLWRWRLKPTGEAGRDDDLDKAWRQMLRWLVVDVPARVELTVEAHADASGADVAQRDPPQPPLSKGGSRMAGAVRLVVRLRERDFAPLDNAAVELAVSAPDGEIIKLAAEPSLAEPGLYEAAFVPRSAGAFRVLGTVTDSEGNAAGTAEAGWAADPAADEFAATRPNTKLLTEIAERTGGEVLAAGAIDTFVAGLPSRSAPVTERWTYPLWHQAWVFAMALGCLIGEWALRRWKGLA